jgi:MFS family permease
METLILGWYVLVQTGSVLWLTAFGSLQFLGTLAAPMFGVLGDRLGGRVVLCALRAMYAALAGVLTLLALTDLLSPLWVLVVAALAGIVRPNDQVIRNTLIGETIPPAHLMGALGLSRATMDSARGAGALAGAGLSTALGVSSAYVVITILYVVSLALTFGVSRRPPMPDPTAVPQGASLAGPSRWRDLTDGLVLIWTRPELLAMMLLAFLVNLTAYPVTGGLMPYAAQRVYHVDATGLGWLVAAFAFGGLLASLTMVLTGGPRRGERTTLAFTVLWYALLLVFGHVENFGAGLLTLVAAGFVQNVAMIAMMALLLAAAGERFRGRVMGVRMLAVYGLPLGLIPSGVLIDHIGFPLTITALAGAGLLVTVLIGIRWRASMWHKGRKAALACLALFVLTSGAMANDISPALRSEFAPSGTLRIGLNHGNFLLVTPGSSATDPRGVASDLGRELGRRLGLPVEFIKFETAGGLADAAKTGGWDVAFLGAEPQRANEIAFTAAYLEIPATYMVPAGSPIRTVADVDREGVRIVVAERSAYELYLTRTIKHAKLLRTKGNDAAVDLFVSEKLEALAGLKPRLITDVKKVPGARMLDGQFTAVQQAVGTPKARTAAARYLSTFVEDVKASGLVGQAISRNGAEGVSVAPPASH